jgi:hypothetical protein
MDPKIIVGAVLLGGGVLYYFVTKDAPESTNKIDYGQVNRDNWKAFEDNRQTVQTKEKDDILAQIAGADDHTLPKMEDKLTAINKGQFQSNQFATQVGTALAAGTYDNKALFAPSEVTQKQQAVNQLNSLPFGLSVFAQDKTTTLQNQVNAETSMDSIFNRQENDISDRAGRAQTQIDMANILSYSDPRQRDQELQKGQRELDKALKSQQELEKQQQSFQQNLDAGKYDTVLPPQAQYERNKAAAPTTTQSPWFKKFGVK